jgi:cobyrinic acid a,c-diamide synthase
VVIPRVVVAGTASGVGKTTVATGLMAALARRGDSVAGFKVGPDFIDPSYHALATGRPGRNLDAFLSGPELIAPLFLHGAAGADVAVVEGVMGLFDGRSGDGELASTAHVAKLLDAPVLLVVDAGGMARSVAALVHGYATFDPDLRLAGVVLNRVGSPWHEELLRDALTPSGPPVVGVLRRDPELSTPERHLGLVPVAERRAEAARAASALGERVAASCDLEAIVALARGAGPLPGAAWDPRGALAAAREGGPGASPRRGDTSTRHGGRPVPSPPRGRERATPRPGVAVAGGPAFSFLYEENLELLRAAGAELLPFDPREDPALPEGTRALLLGGGFPEAHAAELAANEPLREEVRALAESGAPVVGECGGNLYLGRELDGHPMCGVIDARARMTDSLSLGYREAEALADSSLAPRGARLRGHEHHYTALDPPAGPAPAWRLRARGRDRDEGWISGGVHASYLHSHWASTPEVAARVVGAAS